jgi:hypothetical protein
MKEKLGKSTVCMWDIYIHTYIHSWDLKTAPLSIKKTSCNEHEVIQRLFIEFEG